MLTPPPPLLVLKMIRHVMAILLVWLARRLAGNCNATVSWTPVLSRDAHSPHARFLSRCQAGPTSTASILLRILQEGLQEIKDSRGDLRKMAEHFLQDCKCATTKQWKVICSPSPVRALRRHHLYIPVLSLIPPWSRCRERLYTQRALRGC